MAIPIITVKAFLRKFIDIPSSLHCMKTQMIVIYMSVVNQLKVVAAKLYF